MKIYNLLLAAALMATATNAMAEQRTESEARLLAKQYINAQSTFAARMHAAADLQLVQQNALKRQAHKAKAQTADAASATLATPYYVYNLTGGGYVVVSGTTALEPVIGYSEQGTITPEGTLPDGLRYWLGYAAEAAAYAEQHPEAVAPHPAKAARHGVTPGMNYAKGIDYNKDIAPLLENSPIGNIQWGQDAPYYDQCPMKGGRRCYTGCMATAMSQVLAYHQYPKNYDWAEILPTYKGGKGTATQKSEVARLNHDVGVALNMEYGTDQSGSVSTQYSKALRDQFGIHENVALINRDDFTYGEWMDILLSEFMAGRPVIYDGVSNDGGHAFVIDGYRAKDGFVHVNWGWEGMSDGYYNIILLNPQETGIGAVLSSGFTSYQDAVVGIEPDHQKQVNYYCPLQGYGMQGELVIGTGYAELAKGDRQGYISFSNIPNMKGEAFSGTFGALFIDKDGKEVARVKAGTVSATASTMNSNPHATPSGGYYTIPTLPDGVYRVYCYVEDNASHQWAVLRTAIDKPNFCTMTQKDGRAFFEISQHHPTGLEVVEWSFDTTSPQYGTMGITVTIQNNGKEIEYGSYALSVDVPNQLSRNFYDEFHRLLPGESEKVTFPVLLNEYGEYSIRALNLYRLNGGGSADIVEPFKVKFRVDRTLSELIQLLNAYISETQSILDKGRLSGNYPTEACDAFQKVIDEVKAASTGTLDVATINALIQKLDDATVVFYQSLSSSADKTYWGYVDGKKSSVDQGWCPGGPKPVYCGISINESDLSAYIGGQIIGLRCQFGTDRWGPWKVDDIFGKVFLLDYDGSYPGDHILATSQEFNPHPYGDYAEYLFDQPYTIGAGGVLCVAEVTTPKGGGYYTAMGACKSVTTPGACWLNNGGGWEDLYYTYGNQACGVAIQAIIVGGGSVTDGKLTNLSAQSVAVNQEITINGTFQNLSSDGISSYELQWTKDNGQTGTKTISAKVGPAASNTFSLAVPGFGDAKLHNITVSVKALDGKADQIADNSTVTVQVPVTARNYIRNVVCEEGTGTWCMWCPRGIVAFETMKEKYGDRFIGVSIHTGNDPLAYNGANYTPLTSLYLSSAPSGLINRKPSCFTQMDPKEVETIFLKESEQCIAAVEAKAYYDEATRTVTVVSETEFGYDFSGANYRLSYLVLEDQLGKYPQTNGYSGGRNGAMGGWEDKLSTVMWTYDDVLREQLPAFDGKAGSIPSSVVGGQKYKYSYSFALPANVKDPANVRIAVLILDPTTVPAEIVNAVQTKLVTDAEGIDTVLAPTDTTAPTYDLQGRRVTTKSGLTIQSGRKQLR